MPRFLDHTATADCEVRAVQPYQAHKAYLCPGCNREIPAGAGHIVAVPLDAPTSGGTGTVAAGATGSGAAPPS
ncbi:MAG: hypothetical protein R2716_06470 [Microthrixaceae bacterium]